MNMHSSLMSKVFTCCCTAGCGPECEVDPDCQYGYICSQARCVEKPDPCDPNPCGPNTAIPSVVGDRCKCSCLPNMIGSPPNCRPECVLNSDCSPQLACINRKCQDPCPGLCGVNAYCRVRNHVPICVCNQGYIGDPFTSCRLPPSKTRL